MPRRARDQDNPAATDPHAATQEPPTLPEKKPDYRLLSNAKEPNPERVGWMRKRLEPLYAAGCDYIEWIQNGSHEEVQKKCNDWPAAVAHKLDAAKFVIGKLAPAVVKVDASEYRPPSGTDLIKEGFTIEEVRRIVTVGAQREPEALDVTEKADGE